MWYIMLMFQFTRQRRISGWLIISIWRVLRRLFKSIKRVIPLGQQQMIGSHKITNTWPMPLTLLIRFFWLARVIPRPKFIQIIITARTGQMKYQSMFAKPLSQRKVVSLTPYQETNLRRDSTEKTMKLTCTPVQPMELTTGTRLAITVLRLPLISSLSLAILGRLLDLQRL